MIIAVNLIKCLALACLDAGDDIIGLGSLELVNIMGGDGDEDSFLSVLHSAVLCYTGGLKMLFVIPLVLGPVQQPWCSASMLCWYRLWVCVIW